MASRAQLCAVAGLVAVVAVSCVLSAEAHTPRSRAFKALQWEPNAQHRAFHNRRKLSTGQPEVAGGSGIMISSMSFHASGANGESNSVSVEYDGFKNESVTKNCGEPNAAGNVTCEVTTTDKNGTVQTQTVVEKHVDTQLVADDAPAVGPEETGPELGDDGREGTPEETRDDGRHSGDRGRENGNRNPGFFNSVWATALENSRESMDERGNTALDRVQLMLG